MTTTVLGRTNVDGNLGENPVFSDVKAENGKIIEAVINGVLETYLVEGVQKSGGQELSGGNYANPIGGESISSTNVGNGSQFALPKSGAFLPFRTLVAGPGVTLTQNADNITIEVNVATYKTKSTHSENIASSLTITPGATERVSIQAMYTTGTGSNNTFSVTAAGVDFVTAGSLILKGEQSAVTNTNEIKVGNTSGGGGVDKWVFGAGEEVVITKGAAGNIILAYNIEEPDA